MAELGFVISIFLMFKYGMLLLFPMVFCASLITSYALVSFSSMEQSHLLILLGSLCLLINLIISATLCTFVRNRTPKGINLQENVVGTSLLESFLLEFQPGCTFSEFLKQNKSQDTLKAEQLKFENFVKNIYAQANNEVNTACFFMPRDP